MPPFTSKRKVSEKPQHLEKGKAKRISPDKKKSNSLQQPQFTLREDEEELLPECCEHIQFLDCEKRVGRVIFECWHCHQGIICEYTGEPMMGEYKGHPSLIQVKVQCPNCEQTAIRLTTGQVLSTTAIPSPWQE
ncbi:hypothetical protein [Nostoc sp. FACHB-888]|uniref:hypothetical protein n=1 Tax=Nostoc sp. FACHB-888 TaxID=2692842 RepID=UPI00168731AC|nr:hypothetical protein [Nostoc sp. FACHB-888]MBD2248852.1 hypothetical protein [Nostoc sp. FACHB-888]